ncbi:MAG: hypothetical protein A2289_01575 [Deltaproteobacteria bacterium RIFOXYA12_FULL_58_15]|nr:MAG: hypothetical protein A2289_01575 [Deltaproteobacteria bacterium RIFOXYA12_FULL_58_15]OGR12135.1 MAG: hypothetical protein A2341_10990 [Deltaproteobacteria bacterium RIFOXYB12_FULL_58_9]
MASAQGTDPTTTEETATVVPETAATEETATAVPETAATQAPLTTAPWMFWTGVGVTGAATVAAVVMAAMAKDAENDFNTLAAKGINGPVSGKDLAELEETTNDRYAFANAMIATAAGALAATALLWLVTDFDDRAQTTTLLISPTQDGAAIGFVTAF